MNFLLLTIMLPVAAGNCLTLKITSSQISGSEAQATFTGSCHASPVTNQTSVPSSCYPPDSSYKTDLSGGAGSVAIFQNGALDTSKVDVFRRACCWFLCDGTVESAFLYVVQKSGGAQAQCDNSADYRKFCRSSGSVAGVGKGVWAVVTLGLGIMLANI